MKVPVTVYTLPNCVQCESTKRMLDRNGIIYTVEDLTAEKATEFKTQGHMAAPVVVAGTKTWSGFRFEKIQSLVTYIRSMESK